jgi:hypothetical protein
LEHVLEGDTHFALGTTDGLLSHLREPRVRLIDRDFGLKFVVVVKRDIGDVGKQGIYVASALAIPRFARFL